VGLWYATREDVRLALDSKESAQNSAQIDRAIESASREAERICARKFAPVTATRYFPRPSGDYSRAYRLWLDENELISVTTLSSGGTAIASTDYFLEPVNSGPPFRSIELDLDSGASFTSGASSQRQISITGLWGYNDDQDAAGALAEALDASETEVQVTNSSVIGVGHILKVDSERMIVNDKQPLDTAQNLGIALTDRKNDNTVAVTDGTMYFAGETIKIDAELMYVVSISANTLTVVRGEGGSVLAAHSIGADIYALRSLTVSRGALGSTAATHSSAAAVTKWHAPEGVRDYVIASAIVQNSQEATGYGQRVGSEMAERDSSGSENLSGRGLVDKRRTLRRTYARQFRKRAV